MKALLTPRRRTALAVAVVVAGLALVLARYTGGPKLFLDYLKVLVWPLTLVIGVWWLRDILRDKLRQLVELALPGGAAAKFDADRADVEASEELAPVAKALVRPDRRTVSFDEAEDEFNMHVVIPPAEVESRMRTKVDEQRAVAERAMRAREEERRAAFEKIFSEGAEWGYKLCVAGLKEIPVPAITWLDDEVPVITHAVGRQDGIGAGLRTDDPRMAERLENEIRRLLRRIDDPMGSHTDKQAARAELRRLQSLLSIVDRDSPLVHVLAD